MSQMHIHPPSPYLINNKIDFAIYIIDNQSDICFLNFNLHYDS